MTENPFEGAGGGGFDMNALLQQAQQMQERLEVAQSQLAETRVEATAGGPESRQPPVFVVPDRPGQWAIAPPERSLPESQLVADPFAGGM